MVRVQTGERYAVSARHLPSIARLACDRAVVQWIELDAVIGRVTTWLNVTSVCRGFESRQPPSRALMNIIGMRDNGMRRNAPSLKHWLA